MTAPLPTERDVLAGQGTEQAALGQAIRRLREVRRLSIRDLAHEAAMSSGHLSVIERGRGNPRLSTLFAIAEALDTTLSQLVCGGGAGAHANRTPTWEEK